MSNIIVTLKNKIKAEIIEVSDFSASSVKDYPTTDFQTYPACSVRSDEGTGEYETTSENYEEYFFTLFFLQIIDAADHNPAKSRQIMEDIVGDICLHFDTDEFMSGISMPSGYAFLGVRPLNWRIFDEEAGKFVVGEIKLVCRVSKTI